MTGTADVIWHVPFFGVSLSLWIRASRVTSHTIRVGRIVYCIMDNDESFALAS